MPIDERGTGTTEFIVTSVVLNPSYTQTPVFIPGQPPPEPVEVPEKVTATFTPVNDPASEATISGTFTISTELIDAFDAGATYLLTLATMPDA